MPGKEFRLTDVPEGISPDESLHAPILAKESGSSLSDVMAYDAMRSAGVEPDTALGSIASERARSAIRHAGQ